MERRTEASPADRMTRARLFVGIDQLEMAELLGKSRNTVSSYERGVSEPPLSVLAQWALITGRSIDWIVWGDSGRPSDLEPVNAATPAEAGAADWVRHEGFEPPTFWSVVSPAAALTVLLLAMMRERATR